MRDKFDPRKVMEFRRIMGLAQRGQDVFLGELKGYELRLGKRSKLAQSIRRTVRKLTEIDMEFFALSLPERLTAGTGEALTCGLGAHEVQEGAKMLVRRAEKFRAMIGCVPCWQTAGRWCDRHDDGRVGYEDGTTVCLSCADETAARVPNVGEFLSELRPLLTTVDRIALDTWLDTLSRRTETPPEACLAFMLAVASLRRGTDPEALMQAVSECRSPYPILPDSLRPPTPPRSS